MIAKTEHRSLDQLVVWLVFHKWLVMELATRDDGSWDMEAISPMGVIVEFAGDDPGVRHWAQKPARVEIVNDGDMPVIVTTAGGR